MRKEQNLTNRLLVLDQNFVLEVLDKSIYVKDFWKMLGFYPHERLTVDEFEQKFKIDIAAAVKKNFWRKKEDKRKEDFAKDRVCKKCQKHFTWNQNPYSDFCSRSCARSYSASFANGKKISARIRELNQKMHVIKCISCGKELLVPFCVTRKECDECLHYIGKCVICGKLIPVELRRNKTCSKECGLKLGAQSNSATQKIRHSSGGCRKGAGYGKKGWYKGFWCDSSWELAYVIYNLEYGIQFERNTTGYEYFYKDAKHKYYPDFILADGTYVEIKGYYTEQAHVKHAAFRADGHVLHVIDKKEIQQYLDYAMQQHGKDFIELYEKQD